MNRNDDFDSFASGLRSRLASGGPLCLPTTCDMPLAFDVPLPPEEAATARLGTTRGHIAIRFDDFRVSGIGAVEVGPVPRGAGPGPGPADAVDAVDVVGAVGAVAARVRWPRLRVEGRYALGATPAPLITLDTGGTMLDDGAVGGADGPDRGLTPEQRDGLIEQAHAERRRLMDTPNGQRLVELFHEHSEAFNTVFVTSPVARMQWVEGGATREMALHTHRALTAGPGAGVVVNPPDVRFGRRGEHGERREQGMTYNENAFVQQLQIVVNTIAVDANLFDPDAEIDPDSKYTKAGLAALTFGKGVAQTGNTKGDVKPMTGDEVHAAVKDGRPPPHATLDELKNVLEQAGHGGDHDGGAAAAVAAERHWRVLDEDDRRLVRRHLYLAAAQRAAESPATEDLWEGWCRADLAGVEATLALAPAGDRGAPAPAPSPVGDAGPPPPAGDAGPLVSVALELPAFEFELDDAAWVGVAADVARDRLERVSFVRSLLRERIQAGLRDHLVTSAERVAAGAGG